MGFMNQIKKSNRIDLEKVDKNNKLTGKKEINITGNSSDVAGSQYKTFKIVSSLATGTSPTIRKIDPANNAVNVANNKVITVTFVAPIKEGDMRIELCDSSGTQIPITLLISGNVLTIDPLELLEAGTKYTLNLHNGCVTNYLGIKLAHITFVFTTREKVCNVVSIDPPTLTVLSIDPANNAVNILGDKLIKVSFSEPIKEGDMWIELYSGGKVVPLTMSISGNVLTINPTSPLTTGKYTLNMHTGSVTDLAGNPLALYRSSFTVDSTPPTVISCDPINNSMEVPMNKLINVTFSEPIKEGDMWIELYSGGKVVPITMSISGNVLTINPTSPLTNGKYTLNMHTGSVTDLAGNPLALYRSSFTVDSTPPTVSLIVPVNNSVKVPRDKVIKVTFREPIKEGDMWIELYSGGKVVPITMSISGNVLTIDPVELLEARTKYTLNLHNGCVTDYAGNKLAPIAFVFTTSEEVFNVGSIDPKVVSIDPINNSMEVPMNKLINVTFSEPIKEGDMWIELYGGGKVVPITMSISGNVLTIDPVELLEAGTKYTIGLHTGCVTDYAGNKLAPIAFFFTTRIR